MTRVNFHHFTNKLYVFETTDIHYESLFLSKDGAIFTHRGMVKHGAVLGGSGKNCIYHIPAAPNFYHVSTSLFSVQYKGYINYKSFAQGVLDVAVR
jgi:hypothetical protein